MQNLQETPLFASAAALDDLALIANDQDWTWRQVHGASLRLSTQLPEKGAVYNLCTTRLGFLVTWLAALRRGLLQLLPPSGGQTELKTVLETSTDAIVVVDNARALSSGWSEHARTLVLDPVCAELPHCGDDALAWSPPLEPVLVRLYTSGSTGVPEPQDRTLGQLVRGAQVLADRLGELVEGGLSAVQRIVCSVPPQHMFGLETSVMLSLVAGIPVRDRRPLLPGDVKSALEEGREGALWVTTPLHLRALAQAAGSVGGCCAVVASTMPLATTLATSVESLVGAPVLEIYGSTETGVLAMRRTAKESRWWPVSGVRLQPGSVSTSVHGEHFTSPCVLNDCITTDDAGAFELAGRSGDVIKLAGRRASLSGLNLLLQDMPGLSDGILHLPSSGAPDQRLVLVYAGQPLDHDAVRAWLRERVDPVFVPRTIIQVERLPRADNGKLPRPALDALCAQWFEQRSSR